MKITRRQLRQMIQENLSDLPLINERLNPEWSLGDDVYKHMISIIKTGESRQEFPLHSMPMAASANMDTGQLHLYGEGESPYLMKFDPNDPPSMIWELGLNTSNPDPITFADLLEAAKTGKVTVDHEAYEAKGHDANRLRKI